MQRSYTTYNLYAKLSLNHHYQSWYVFWFRQRKYIEVTAYEYINDVLITFNHYNYRWVMQRYIEALNLASVFCWYSWQCNYISVQNWVRSLQIWNTPTPALTITTNTRFAASELIRFGKVVGKFMEFRKPGSHRYATIAVLKLILQSCLRLCFVLLLCNSWWPVSGS